MSNNYVESDLEFAQRLQRDEAFLSTDSLLASQLQNEYDGESRHEEPGQIRLRSGRARSRQRNVDFHVSDQEDRSPNLRYQYIRRGVRGRTRGYRRYHATRYSINEFPSDIFSSYLQTFRNWVSDDEDNGDNYEIFWELGESLGEAVPRGLNPREINTLPTSTFTASARRFSATSPQKQSIGNSEDSSCLVCLCEYEESENLRTLPCLHRFHTNCIDQWIKANAVCPICRVEIKEQLRNQR